MSHERTDCQHLNKYRYSHFMLQHFASCYNKRISLINECLFNFQRLFPGHKMTRTEEPDLLIDHDSGGGCKKFLSGSPVLEPFAYSGVASQKKPGSEGSLGRWFGFPSITSAQPPAGKTTDGKSFTSCSLSSSSSSSVSSLPALSEDNPVIVVHSKNNVILDMTDENTRWSTSTTPCLHQTTVTSPTIIKSPQAVIPPPMVVPPGLAGKTTKLRHTSNYSSNNNNIKSTKHGKNINSTNKNINNSSKNNCTSNNNSSTNSINNNNSKSAASNRINNCATASVPVTVGSEHIDPSNSGHHRHNHGGSGSDDEDSGARHLIIRYMQCNERPNKKQLVTLGLISVVLLIILIILLIVFLSPPRTPSSNSDINSTSSNTNEISDAFISSDISSNLNSDYSDLDDSDSYDDGDAPYYSSTSSSSSSGSSSPSIGNTNSGLDLKKVSKLSWDLLNSNQDASSRGSSGGGNSKSTSGSVISPLSGSGRGEGEIILPAKMIYTSSGDSTDLMPSENGTGSQNKKRSCCRTQKYSQVIKREGCEPLTIVNKMCFGQCVSVWVPGLFASFPVCRPSKSTFKTVTLTCGHNREKRKRVRIEKVRRCSCMEIEPTAASL